MLENYRSGFVWRVMRSNLAIRRGLVRAAVAGGCLQKVRADHAGAPTPTP